MNEEEKLNSVPNLKEMGNEMFKKKDYDNASKLYSKAIGMLEQLMLRFVLFINFIANQSYQLHEKLVWLPLFFIVTYVLNIYFLNLSSMLFSSSTIISNMEYKHILL